MEIWHYWIILGIILIMAEIFTPGFLLASFGIAAFVSGLSAYFDFGLGWQLVVFSAISLIVFFGFRPAYKKYFVRFDDQRETGIKALTGKICRVTETINSNENTGRIRIGGESWKALSENGEKIQRGEWVKVIKIESTTAFVVKQNKGE